ncbi:MAG: DUF4440 domain-containing protein [Saprospiraceae bacterium]
MKKISLLLFLLLNTFAVFSQNEIDNKTSNQINEQVWKVFQEAWSSYDAEKYIGIHTTDVLRVTPWGIKHGPTFREKTMESFSRENPPKRSISFQFEHRIYQDDLAYEVGYYKSATIEKDGNERAHYGRFHVVLKKQNGHWKIAQDWDTDDVNGRKVTAADFEKLAMKVNAKKIDPIALDKKYLEKVKTLDSTLENLYGVISGEKGEARDRDLFRYLFKPDAKLIPSGKNQAGKTGCKFMTPDDYIKSSGEWLVENGFFEKEIARKTDTFGNITQVFSTYESFHSESDQAPFMRGINSIQLLNDGERWWVLNIYWMQETEEAPIPVKYLKD